MFCLVCAGKIFREHRGRGRRSSGEPFSLRSDARKSCCALPRSRAVYARVCCEKRRLSSRFGLYAQRCPSRSIFWALCLRRQYLSTRLCQRCRTSTAALKNARSGREMLAHIDTRNARHVDAPSPNHVQPNRKRPTRALIPHRSHETRARRCKTCQCAVWFSLRRRLYARHDTKQPEERPPRAVLGALLRAPPLESRRIKSAAPIGKRLPERRRRPITMKQSTAMLLGMLTSKMKQIEDMSTSARAIALTASTAGTASSMFDEGAQRRRVGRRGPAARAGRRRRRVFGLEQTAAPASARASTMVLSTRRAHGSI